MSHSEIARFLADLKAKPALLAEVRKDGRDEAIVAVAARQGYSFSVAEAKAFRPAANAGGRPISDGELERVAGGVAGEGVDGPGEGLGRIIIAM
jgi:predicted ribosomally synthesized peptide with nif11-like leader